MEYKGSDVTAPRFRAKSTSFHNQKTLNKFKEKYPKYKDLTIKEFKNNGDLIYGPFPADGFFGSGNYKKYDAILAMYHDQGLIPFKSLSFGSGVNFTANLSVVRTSPDHGTGFDIAGKNMASETSLRSAIYLAHDILNNRKEANPSQNLA